jgi:hypothetical protein
MHPVWTKPTAEIQKSLKPEKLDNRPCKRLCPDRFCESEIGVELGTQLLTRLFISPVLWAVNRSNPGRQNSGRREDRVAKRKEVGGP